MGEREKSVTRWSVPIERNESATDVLFELIKGRKRVKEIVKALKQPQPTVSAKLEFLIENKVVKKNKWNFEVNWERLYEIFRKVAREQIAEWVKGRKKVEYFMEIFDDERIKSIFEVYAYYYDGMPIKSIGWMVNSYLLGMTQVDDSKLIKVDKRMVELKEYIKMESPEKSFFEDAEGIGEIE